VPVFVATAGLLWGTLSVPPELAQRLVGHDQAVAKAR
jgi:hypothetical protein